MTSETNQCCGCQDEPTHSSAADTATLAQANFDSVSVFDVPKMDCPSEENLIRTAFSSFGETVSFAFDIPNRQVRIYHSDTPDKVETVIRSVGLGASCVSYERIDSESVHKARENAKAQDLREASVLKWLLWINAVMFFIELSAGIVAQSAGLIADSLDMFADAAVYLVALYAVGKSAQTKLKAAHMSGWLEAALAVGLLVEVIRRAIMGGEPVSILMMGVGAIALLANLTCLVLIYQVRNNGTHMKASMIFSANDVLANASVIVAGGLVAVADSQIPDLIIGVIISCVVLWGALRILRLR
ncbi:MAG: cation transporter [Hahellaceae bacterium]|nr:cation transporter [Hahellaceae bacterium]